ncbi:MAG: tetratricopeptide repeat protein [Bacteroidales bacterium]|nr:tetratricopeptide repeat protein [Bacteroidota bacterium]MBL6950369.1 tetratricopeptide repeat protein [Bacteroidales bacterium]
MRLIVFLSLQVLIFLMPDKVLVAQSVSDTLEQAKKLRDNGKLKAALKLLETYHAEHQRDLNSGWVYAQTAYWAKRYKLAKEIYELTIRYHPENMFIQFDYARMLVNIGKYDKAIPYLKNFLVYYPGNIQVHLLLAKEAFWKGKYKEAEKKATELLKANPADTEAASLLNKILQARSPWIGFTGSFYTDDQPLQTISPFLESNIWLHPLSTLRFSIRTPLFSQGGTYTNALWIQAGNSSFIWKGNWKITADAGVLKYPYKNTTTWTGNFELGKRSFRHLVTVFQAERKPYFSTGSSIDTVILEYHVAETIGWNNFDSWNGQILFNFDYFLADHNSITSFAAWGFAPPIKMSVFDFRLGYGFSYSNARENRFVKDGSDSEIIANYDPTAGIKGIYYPYFTPNDQQIHSGLAAIGIHPTKWIDLGISGNVGFYATTLVPYFYLDTDSTGTIVISDREFSKKRYFPYTISAFAAVQLSKKISLRADYRYNSTYFYSEHSVSLQLMIHLWNEKRRK